MPEKSIVPECSAKQGSWSCVQFDSFIWRSKVRRTKREDSDEKILFTCIQTWHQQKKKKKEKKKKTGPRVNMR